MGWARIKAHWQQVRGRWLMRWGRWTDDPLDVIEGRRALLLGRLQESYGATPEEAEQQVQVWECQSDPERRPMAQPATRPTSG
jgi:uncharacterized protein YjbJ (UPF0337 family)